MESALLSGKNSAHVGGDTRGTRIFSEHVGFIYAVIHSRVNEDTQADDLFQDFFLSLISRPPPLGVKNIKSYLYKAIVNDTIDANRRIQKYHSCLHRYAQHLRYNTGNGDPKKALINTEEMNTIFDVIKKQLRPSEAKALTWRYKNGSSIDEIADKMCVDSRSVSRYIYSGLKKMRRLLTLK